MGNGEWALYKKSLADSRERYLTLGIKWGFRRVLYSFVLFDSGLGEYYTHLSF